MWWREAARPVEYLGRLGLLGPDMLLVHAIETNSARSRPHQGQRNARGPLPEVQRIPWASCGAGGGNARAAEFPCRWAQTAWRATKSSICLRRCAWFLHSSTSTLTTSFAWPRSTAHELWALEAQVGSLETGKRADFAVVALRDSNMDPTEAMIRFARPADIKATFVNGSEKVFDLSKVQEDVRRIQHELRKADNSIELESRE